jgi:hypothetical protein
LTVAQEITLCYVDELHDASLRGWHFMHYGFECQCKACKDRNDTKSFAHASHERRWKMRELDLKLRMVSLSEDERFKARLHMVAAMKSEGLCSPQMADHYLQIARASASKDDMEFAVKAAKKALEMFTVCCGAEHEFSVRTVKTVRAFEKQLRR